MLTSKSKKNCQVEGSVGAFTHSSSNENPAAPVYPLTPLARQWDRQRVCPTLSYPHHRLKDQDLDHIIVYQPRPEKERFQ